MQSSRKNNLQSNSCIDRQVPFEISNYKFRGLAGKSTELTKTLTRRKFTQDELSTVTKLYHKNAIGLKKIAKTKRNTDQDIYWLYYETVPYSLEMILSRNQFDVRPETLQAALVDLNNYLVSLKINLIFCETNIGVNENGVVKVYLPIQGILRSGKTGRIFHEGEQKIREIKMRYSSLYSRRSIKPSIVPQTISSKRLSQSKLNKLTQIKCDFDKIRKNIKSEQSKNNSVIESPKKQDKKIKLTYAKGEPNTFTINIYNQRPQFNQNKQLVFNSPAKEKEKPKINIQKQPYKHYYDYDDESIDTYQMELGEDFQMPSIRTNQKLRQTVLNTQKSWDTFTNRSPPNINKKMNVHESAGNKGFANLVEVNKRVMREAALKQAENEDNKTVQQSPMKKNWQTSTIKSALPPNIQDRVQQALTKTKNLMQMLKNTKSFSAGK